MRYLLLITITAFIVIVTTSCNDQFNTQPSFGLTNNVNSATFSDYYAEQRFGEWVTGELIYKEKLVFNQTNQLQNVVVYSEDEVDLDIKYYYEDNSLISVHIYNNKGDEILRRKVQSFSSDEYTYKDIDVDGEILRVGILQFKNGKEVRSAYFDYRANATYKTLRNYNEDGILIEAKSFSERLEEIVFDEGHYLKLKDLTPDTEPIIHRYEYLEFDKYGNWLSRLEFLDDDTDPIYKTKRSLEYSE